MSAAGGLDLSKCSLESVPLELALLAQSLPACATLTSVNLSHNQLQGLPTDSLLLPLGGQVRHLNLSNNLLHLGVDPDHPPPAGVQLDFIDVSNNRLSLHQLHHVVAWAVEPPALRTLEANYNPLNGALYRCDIFREPRLLLSLHTLRLVQCGLSRLGLGLGLGLGL